MSTHTLASYKRCQVSQQIDMTQLQPSDVEPMQFDSDSSFTLPAADVKYVGRLFFDIGRAVLSGWFGLAIVVVLYVLAVEMVASELIGGIR